MCQDWLVFRLGLRFPNQQSEVIMPLWGNPSVTRFDNIEMFGSLWESAVYLRWDSELGMRSHASKLKEGSVGILAPLVDPRGKDLITLCLMNQQRFVH